MDKYPRHVAIDMRKYAPTVNNPETYYGLPQNVAFCSKLRDFQSATQFRRRIYAH